MSSNAFGAVAPHPPIIIAEVGGERASVTQASLDGLEQVRSALAAFAPDTVVVMSPHAPAVADAVAVDDAESFDGSLSQFGDVTHHVWAGDPDLARAIIVELERLQVPAIPRSADGRLRTGWLDHGVIVPLSLIDPAHERAIVVLSLSYLDYAAHRRAGQAVRHAADASGKRVAFLASGDLSHRLTRDANAGFSPRARELDQAIQDAVAAGEFGSLMDLDPELVDAGGECGLRSIITLGGYLGDDPVPATVLSYEGPWGVGYLTALAGEEAASRITPPSGSKGGMAGHDESDIVRVARDSIAAWILRGEYLPAPYLPPDVYPVRAGAFVSLHKGGELRGCIGTISATQPTLGEEVAHNAVEAATRDPRFPPVDASELDELDIKVDVLHAPESCDLSDLDPSTYGVIVSSGWRRGLLLPDLEGVDDVADQVAIAMRKAGIRQGEACAIERFKVDRYT